MFKLGVLSRSALESVLTHVQQYVMCAGHAEGGEFGEAIMNEIKVNMENQIRDQVSNVISQQAQNHIADLNTS